MGYRDKNSYDDMGNAGSKRQGSDHMDARGRKVVVVVVLVGVLLCAAVIAVWLMYFPASRPQEESTVSDLIVEPMESPVNVSEHLPPTTSPAQTLPSSALARVDTTAMQPTAVPMPVPVAVQPSPRGGITYVDHRVEEGETLQSIAESYGVGEETIISVNAIKNIALVKAGMVLRIPDRNGQLYTVQAGDSLSIITNRFNPTLGWKTLQELNGLTSEIIHPGQKLFIPSVEIEADGSFSTYSRFVQPAKGRITGLYGQQVVDKETGEIQVLQGIWIEGAQGSAVVASSTGVVVDAGNEPDGLGRFVVLSHADGYRTTYGHLDSVTVKIGDQVKQNDDIGTMGGTGNIGKTALYFSVEQEGTALNPVSFF